MFKRVATVVAAIAFIGQSATAQTPPTPVDIELKLLIDVSGSVSTAEYNLQKNGYVNVFNNAGLWNTFAGTNQTLAVSYSEWANSSLLRTNWFTITNASSAASFASAINSLVGRASVGSGTDLGQAIDFGINALNTNNFAGTKRIIDFSGDGCSSTALAARTNAINANIVLNGLAIGGSGIESCYGTYITPNGFVEGAATFDDFEVALGRKIGREIGVIDVPEPSTFALVAVGLFGLVGASRRRRA